MKIKHLLSVCAGVAIVACGSNNQVQSDVKVVGGVVTDQYPEVVSLDVKVNNGPRSVCTGFFVTKTTLISVGSCLSGGDSVVVNGVETSEVYVHSKFDPTANIGKVEQYDIGIVRFAQPMVDKPAVISATAPAVGDTFTLVGFGAHEMTADFITGVENDGQKRMGTNRIRLVNKGQVFATRGRFNAPATGEKVSLGLGDSGAPAYNEMGEVIGFGMAIEGVGRADYVSRFLSLKSKSISDFLKLHLAE